MNVSKLQMRQLITDAMSVIAVRTEGDPPLEQVIESMIDELEEDVVVHSHDMPIVKKAREHVEQSTRGGSDGSVIFLSTSQKNYRLSHLLAEYDSLRSAHARLYESRIEEVVEAEHGQKLVRVSTELIEDLRRGAFDTSCLYCVVHKNDDGTYRITFHRRQGPHASDI